MVRIPAVVGQRVHRFEGGPQVAQLARRQPINVAPKAHRRRRRLSTRRADTHTSQPSPNQTPRSTATLVLILRPTFGRPRQGSEAKRAPKTCEQTRQGTRRLLSPQSQALQIGAQNVASGLDRHQPAHFRPAACVSPAKRAGSANRRELRSITSNAATNMPSDGHGSKRKTPTSPLFERLDLIDYMPHWILARMQSSFRTRSHGSRSSSDSRSTAAQSVVGASGRRTLRPAPAGGAAHRRFLPVATIDFRQERSKLRRLSGSQPDCGSSTREIDS